VGRGGTVVANTGSVSIFFVPGLNRTTPCLCVRGVGRQGLTAVPQPDSVPTVCGETHQPLSLSLSLSLVTAVWVIGVSLSLSAWPASERGGTEFVSHTEEAGRQAGRMTEAVDDDDDDDEYYDTIPEQNTTTELAVDDNDDDDDDDDYDSYE